MKEAAHNKGKATDAVQERLAEYANSIAYDQLPPEVAHAAKVRVIDVLGATIAGFFGEPCRIARNVAALTPNPQGSTIIGTRMKTSPDLAAFVNATTSRYPELTDSYHWPDTAHGHAGDVVMPLLGAAEHGNNSGRDLITAVVLAYETFLEMSHCLGKGTSIDNTVLEVLGNAIGASKLWKLPREKIAHAISMAVVPNVILNQVRKGNVTMFKAAAAGQAGRAGIFAAMLAREGMEGPHMPYEGKAGWCDQVAHKRFTIGEMGGPSARYKILDTQLKMRPTQGSAIPVVMACEKIAPLSDPDKVQRVVMEVFGYALRGVSAHHDLPKTREAADHSMAYNVATALLDGTIKLNSFDEAHRNNPKLHTLLPKVELVENQEFTRAFERVPVEHRARVTITMTNGDKLVGEAGGDADDMAAPKSDAQVAEKFRSLTEEYLGAKRVNELLDRLWSLEKMEDVAEIPPAVVLG